MIPKFHYDLRPIGTQTEYRLHLPTKIYMYILLKNILQSRISKVYTTEVHSNTFLPRT